MIIRGFGRKKIKTMRLLLLLGIIFVTGCVMNRKSENIDRHLTFKELKGSYDFNNLLQNDSFRNHESKLDSLELRKYIVPTEIGGVTASRRVAFEVLNSKIKSVIFYCDMVDSGGIQILVNINDRDEYIDYLIISESLRQGPYEKDRAVCFGKDRICIIKNDTIIIKDKFEMAADYTADTYFEEVISKYVISSDGTFKKLSIP